MTGDPQQLARACADALYGRDAAAREMGITIAGIAPGRAELNMIVRNSMLNGHGICHGGYIFALADTAFAYACNSRDEVNVAQSCSIDYLHPVRGGDRLVATATERARSGRTGIYDIAVRNQAGEEVAQFRGRSRRIRGTVTGGPGAGG